MVAADSTGHAGRNRDDGDLAAKAVEGGNNDRNENTEGTPRSTGCKRKADSNEEDDGRKQVDEGSSRGVDDVSNKDLRAETVGHALQRPSKGQNEDCRNHGLEAVGKAAHAGRELDNAADKEEVNCVDYDGDKRAERKTDRRVAVREGFDKARAGEEAAGVDHTGNAADNEDNDRNHEVDDLALRVAIFGIIRFFGIVFAGGEEVAI